MKKPTVRESLFLVMDWQSCQKLCGTYSQ